MAGDRITDAQEATGEKSFMGKKRVEEVTETLQRERSGGVPRTQHIKPGEPGQAITREDFVGEPSGEEIKHDIDLIGVRMGLLSHGVDFLIDNGFPKEVWERYWADEVESLAKITAQALHLDDYKPLVYADTRTPEQSEIMLQIGARLHEARHSIYRKSAYFEVLGIVLDEMAAALQEPGLSELMNREDGEDISDACAYLNRYYFAIHKEIAYAGDAEQLPEEARDEIRDIVLRVLAYKKEHGTGYYDSIAPSLGLTPESSDRITEITQQGYFDLPISKAWRVQQEIAQEGAAGREVNVGTKTASGAAIISASISGKDGKPLTITELEKGIQRAIGNLITEAKGALPIVVTPQQIYRAFARLSPEATVTQQQADEVEQIMDALMYAPSSLDFRVQLEKHKRIKQQPDYDYKGEDSGSLRGPLVPAQKLERATARDGSLVVAYKILEWPVYYRYSHIVGQIARVPNSLLTGPEKKPTRDGKKPEAQGSARNIAMRENILTRVERMIQRRQGKKSYIPLIRIDEIASDCGFTLTRQTERTLQKNLALFLDELKAQGKIKGYTTTKEGRKIVGCTVEI